MLGDVHEHLVRGRPAGSTPNAARAPLPVTPARVNEKLLQVPAAQIARVVCGQPDAHVDGASDQSAKQAPYALDQALEQPEDAGQQAAHEGYQAAEHAHRATTRAA
jgi:hypothetical protein